MSKNRNRQKPAVAVTPPADRFTYRPRHDRQRAVQRLWTANQALVLVGPAGTGKTSAAIGMALQDLASDSIKKIMLCRPAVAIDEELGYNKGSLDEKIQPWVASFFDAAEGFGGLDLHKLASRLELISVGMIGGRTIRDAVMIVDEAQNLSRRQVAALVTRIGPGGRLVFCGDFRQSQVGMGKANPLHRFLEVVKGRLDGLAVVEFLKEDQLRSQFVQDVSQLLEDADY